MIMNASQLIERIARGKYDRAFTGLYSGNNAAAAARYSEAARQFDRFFPGLEDVHLLSCPGRTEIGGNHTDHNHGRVLAGAINLDVVAVCAKNLTNTVRIKSFGYDMDCIDLNTTEPQPHEREHSASLIRGVCARFKALGLPDLTWFVV